MLPILLFFIAVLTLSTLFYSHFGTSPGTLIQLAAKGHQDLYLTGPSGYYQYYYGQAPYYYYYYPHYWRRPSLPYRRPWYYAGRYPGYYY